MADVSKRVRPKPRRYRWIQQLRKLLDYLSALDLDEVSSKIDKLEASQARIEATQSRIIALLGTHLSVPFPPVLSVTRELATGNRIRA